MFDSKTLAHTLVKLSQTENAEKALEQFFTMLEQKNLLGLLPNIKKHIERFEESSSSHNSLIISSKHDLSEKDQSAIKKLVGAEKDAAVEVIHDETVVGGFSAVYQGHIYDGSLRNQIVQLRTQLH